MTSPNGKSGLKVLDFCLDSGDVVSDFSPLASVGWIGFDSTASNSGLLPERQQGNMPHASFTEHS
jgi:hypothetical protein